MNCPSRNDPEALEHSDYNQNPHPLALEKNSDMDGLANRRLQRDHRLQEEQQLDDRIGPIPLRNLDRGRSARVKRGGQAVDGKQIVEEDVESLRSTEHHCSEGNSGGDGGGRKSRTAILVDRARALRRTFVKFGSFVGPGFMVAVAYIDPGMSGISHGIHRMGANYNLRKLRNRCCSWGLLQVPTPLHCSILQHYCNLSSVTQH